MRTALAQFSLLCRHRGALDALSDVPVQVSNLSGITAISAGYDHGLALKSDGTVWAWGRNDVYQCGVDYTGQSELTSVQAAGLSGITAIAAGGWHNTVLKNDGSVWAWGSNYYPENGSWTQMNADKTKSFFMKCDSPVG